MRREKEDKVHCPWMLLSTFFILALESREEGANLDHTEQPGATWGGKSLGTLPSQKHPCTASQQQAARSEVTEISVDLSW